MIRTLFVNKGKAEKGLHRPPASRRSSAASWA
jgi:hypothetical protein